MQSKTIYPRNTSTTNQSIDIVDGPFIVSLMLHIMRIVSEEERGTIEERPSAQGWYSTNRVSLFGYVICFTDEQDTSISTT